MQFHCGHAIAIIVKANLSVYDFIPDVFKSFPYQTTYQENVRSVPIDDLITISTCHPPPSKIARGRAKKKRHCQVHYIDQQ